MFNTTKQYTHFKTTALFLSRATSHSKIETSIKASNFMSPFSNFTTELNDTITELAIYTLFDDENNFYVFIPGLTPNRSMAMFYSYILYEGLLFNTIICSVAVEKLIKRHLKVLHPKLMQDIKKHNLKTINFAGHGFGGAMQCPLFVLIYALLIDFYKNHYNCTDGKCSHVNNPIHPKITCEFLRDFVRQFYLYHYEQGDFEIWSHSEAINLYNRDLQIDGARDNNKNQFNNLQNKSIDEVIHDMMQCDKELLKEVAIEKIYTFGTPGVLSKEWADIYNAYFYNPDNIENSKHLSFESEDDVCGGFEREGGAYYFSIQLYKFLTTLRTNNRSPIGVMIKIQNNLNTPITDIYNYYCQNILSIDHFEFHPVQTTLVNKMNGWQMVRELFAYDALCAISLMLFVIIYLEIPYIIFMPMLLIAKCFGVNIFLHTYQIVISIAAWIGIGILCFTYI